MIGIIGGTGLSELLAGVICASTETPYGSSSSPVIRSEVDGCPLLFLPRHGNPPRIAPHLINYRANIWALKQQGVSKIIAFNAVGGITAAMVTGVLALPHQLVDYSYGRDHSFFDGEANPLQHIDFSSPFSSDLRDSILHAATASGISIIDQAIYAVTQGPRLETAAEIDRLRRDGCDVVGMTAMPEAALARELELEYASVCLVVNPAAGRGDEVISLESMGEVLVAGEAQIHRLIKALVARV